MKGKLKIFSFTILCVLLIVVYFTTAKFSLANDEATQEATNQEEVQVQVDTTIAQEMSKYIETENVAILEQKINIGIVNDDKSSRETEIISTLVPEVHGNQPQDWYVILNGRKLESEKYEYNEENHILRIMNTQMDQQAEKEDWQYGENEYEIVYVYQKGEESQEQEVTLRTAVSTKLYEKDAIIKVDEKQEVLTAKGNLAEMEQTIEGEFYKGFLYANLDREIEIQEKNEVRIVKADLLENVLIQDAGTVVTGNEEQIYNFNANVIYKKTAISKSDIERILGEEGKIVIKDDNGNELASIDSKTEANEDGNVYVEYAGEVHLLQLEIINPQTEGNLWITHTKSVRQQTNGKKEVLQSLVNMRHSNNIITNYGTSETQGNIELKDTTIQNNIQVNKESLSTAISNDLEIQLTLCSNNAKYDLYENPIIEITLPDEVENIEVNSVDLLYEEEMTVKNISVNGKTIRIELDGRQTDYKSGSIEGAVVSVKAKLDLNKLSVNASKEILTRVENNGKVAETKKQIEITSPREIITVNNISSLGVETIGEEKTVATEMAKGEESKNLVVESGIINNNGENIENVTILGDFGTNGAVTLEDRMLENNLGVNVVSPVTVEGAEAKVYYTQNFTATNDLQNSENGWTESTDNIGTASKYLIVINELEKDARVNLSYEINVPENLDYNMQAYEGYTVNYKATSEENENSAVSTYVELTTGVGAEIVSEISANVGNEKLQDGDIVRIGEVIKYTISVENTGTEVVRDINVIGSIPEGTVRVEPVEGFEYAGNTYYEELDEESYKTTIEQLEVGETKDIQYEVRVKNDATQGSSITSKAQITYGETTNESNQLVNTIEEGDIRVTAKRVSDTSIRLNPGQGVEYFAIVENMSTEDKKNVKVSMNIPEIAELKSVAKIMDDDSVIELDKNSEVDLGTMSAGEVVIVRVMLSIKIDVYDKETDMFIYANVTDGDGIKYRSNVYKDLVYGYDIDLQMETTNENEYLKTGDIIEYNIKVTNNSTIDTTLLYLEDKIPEYLTVLEDPNLTEINESFKLAPGESYELNIKAVVNYSDNRLEDTEITNTVTLKVEGIVYKQVSVSHMLQREENSPNIDDDDPQESRYAISGKAWLDENQDGEMQDNERALSNISVYIQNTTTGELVKGQNGESITAKTDANGEYRITGLESQNYIVIFDYDSAKYKLTTYQKDGVDTSKNSKAIEKRFVLESYEKTYGVTDTIEITNRSIANINIGLIESDTFDLALTKTVQKVTVQTSSKTNVYGFSNVNLAKVELSRKDNENVSITIQYQITVINNGEVEGYAKKIVDYLPTGFEIASESSQVWTKEGDTITSTALTNEVIRPGESKTINLTVTREAQGEATGTYSNTAEIAQIYNDQGIDDINSVPGNRVSTEDDISTAELIVSIGTGRAVWYITLITSVILIIGIGIYMIKKKVL